MQKVLKENLNRMRAAISDEWQSASEIADAAGLTRAYRGLMAVLDKESGIEAKIERRGFLRIIVYRKRARTVQAQLNS